MENASKALIIAGAILLAILLISLGIMIFNQAQDTVNNSGMSQAEITAFNNKFLKYEGKGKKTSDIKMLANEVLVSNAEASNASRLIIVWNITKGTSIVKLDDKSAIKDKDKSLIDMSSIEKDKTYTVEAGYCTDPSENRPKAPNTLTKGCIYTMRIIEE